MRAYALLVAAILFVACLLVAYVLTFVQAAIDGMPS